MFVYLHGALCFLFLGALLCVLGFASAIVVSSLDKIGMRQLGLDGAIQAESRKVVLTSPFCFIVMFRSALKYGGHLGSVEYTFVLSVKICAHGLIYCNP